MPDESKAAEEHELMAQITEPLAALPAQPAPLGAEAEFPVVLRGYDRMAVDAYVAAVSEELGQLRAAHSPDLAVRRALERVGEQISGILQRAHETAAQITAASRTEADDRLQRASAEAESLLVDARERLRELDADTDRIWSERRRIVEDTRRLADELGGVAAAAADRFPPAVEDEAPPASEPLEDAATMVFDREDAAGTAATVVASAAGAAPPPGAPPPAGAAPPPGAPPPAGAAPPPGAPAPAGNASPPVAKPRAAAKPSAATKPPRDAPSPPAAPPEQGSDEPEPAG